MTPSEALVRGVSASQLIVCKHLFDYHANTGC